MKSTVDAKVKEKVAQVAQAFECACCFETLGEGPSSGVYTLQAHVFQSHIMPVGAGCGGAGGALRRSDQREGGACCRRHHRTEG